MKDRDGLATVWLLRSDLGRYRWWTVAAWFSDGASIHCPQVGVKLGPVSVNLWRPTAWTWTCRGWYLEIAFWNGDPLRLWPWPMGFNRGW